MYKVVVVVNEVESDEGSFRLGMWHRRRRPGGGSKRPLFNRTSNLLRFLYSM